MLRGPQTPGELNQRTARLQAFPGLEAVHATLDRLGARELVERLERRPGQKEERYRHLLDGQEPSAEWPRDAPAEDDAGPARAAPGIEERVAALETEVVRLRTLLAQLSRPDDLPPSADHAWRDMRQATLDDAGSDVLAAARQLASRGTFTHWVRCKGCSIASNSSWKRISHREAARFSTHLREFAAENQGFRPISVNFCPIGAIGIGVRRREIESANKRTLPSSPFLPSVWTPAMNEDAT
jgi:hypothetical protein